jgi:hypothetical protein
MTDGPSNFGKNIKRPGIVSGNGHKENPFVVATANTVISASIQQQMVDSIFGAGAAAHASRIYYDSPKGESGNSALCEHRVVHGGKSGSVWFDLSLIAELRNDPEFVERERSLFNTPPGTSSAAQAARWLELGYIDLGTGSKSADSISRTLEELTQNRPGKTDRKRIEAVRSERLY